MYYTGNEFFDFFVDIMTFWGEDLSISYGSVFVFTLIVVPIFFICFYFFTTIWTALTKKKKVKNGVPIVTSSIFVALIIYCILYIAGAFLGIMFFLRANGI